jgi:hypothetical protein
VKSARRATKQMNLRLFRFQAVYQMQKRMQESNTAIGFILSCVKGVHVQHLGLRFKRNIQYNVIKKIPVHL